MREVIPIDEAGTRSAQSYNVPLSHNSVSVKQSPTRIDLTDYFVVVDYHACFDTRKVQAHGSASIYD